MTLAGLRWRWRRFRVFVWWWIVSRLLILWRPARLVRAMQRHLHIEETGEAVPRSLLAFQRFRGGRWSPPLRPGDRFIWPLTAEVEPGASCELALKLHRLVVCTPDRVQISGIVARHFEVTRLALGERPNALLKPLPADIFSEIALGFTVDLGALAAGDVLTLEIVNVGEKREHFRGAFWVTARSYEQWWREADAA